MRVSMIFRLPTFLVGFFITCSTMIFAYEISSYSAKYRSGDTEHCRASARYIAGGGIGYSQGYTTLDAFCAPRPNPRNVMPFVDLRGHIFNNGRCATNVGLGLRKIAGCRVYGVNTYYDFRNTKRINYNQIGVGFETLGNLWDFRLNGYVPLGKHVTCPYDTKFSEFLGHSMIVSEKYQLAMDGANAELGVHFGRSQRCDFYAAAGAYYFNGKVGCHVWGGKARLVARLKEYWTLELSNSYDKKFHNRFQFQISFTMPLGRALSEKSTYDGDCFNMPDVLLSSDVLLSRMVQPVERQEIVVAEHVKECSEALDPATCKPYNFVFVDNTSHSAGTYESPYPTLALAQANSKSGDVIYVMPGNGTTNGMDKGITLQSRQKFWGSGIDHPLSTSQGTIIIPAHSISAPTITNSDLDGSGDAVTLTSANPVSGFIIKDAVNNGIIGINAGNVDISDCTLDGSINDHIHLEYTSSSDVAVALDKLTMTNSVRYTAFVDSSAPIICSMKNCTIEDNANGCSLTCNEKAQVLISDNIMSGTTSVSETPIEIIAGASPISVMITNNTIRDNTRGAIQCSFNDTSSANITVSSNMITNNGAGFAGSGLGSALVINANNTELGNCVLNVASNTFTDNGANAVYFHTDGAFHNLSVHATGNTMTDNAGSGFVFATPCDTFTLVSKNNSIKNGGDNGLSVIGTMVNVADMTIINNQITGNTGSSNGIVLSHGGTDLNLTVTGCDLSNNGGSGILMYSSIGIENVTINIANNTISNNQNTGSNAAGGLDLETYINLSGNITNNTVQDNVTLDVYIASAQTSPSVCITMSGNDAGSYTLDSGTGVFNLAPCDVDSVNTGPILKTGVTIVQSCPGGIPCP